jgi:hypothetical protein
MCVVVMVVVVATCSCVLQLLLTRSSLLRQHCSRGVLLLSMPAGLASRTHTCLPLMLHAV